MQHALTGQAKETYDENDNQSVVDRTTPPPIHAPDFTNLAFRGRLQPGMSASLIGR